MVEVQRRGMAAEGASFRLERFEWAAPDRLELAGRFEGLDPPTAGTSLVVRGADGDHRLEGRVVSASADGRPWSAAFLWREAPIAFDTAGLELGGGRVVTLPAPGPAAEAGQRLDIQIGHSQRDGVEATARPMADALRLQAALVAAQDEARHAEAARERLEEELVRARQDLESDRARQAADAERFRAGLATVQEAGEQALAEALEDNARLRDRMLGLQGGLEDVVALRAELERVGEENAGLRAELDRIGTEGAQAQAELQRVAADSGQARFELDRLGAENADLRSQLERLDAEDGQVRGELDRVGAENTALRLELEQLQAEHARARAEIDRLGTEAAAMREDLEGARSAQEDVQRLQARLAAVRTAIGQED